MSWRGDDQTKRFWGVLGTTGVGGAKSAASERGADACFFEWTAKSADAPDLTTAVKVRGLLAELDSRAGVEGALQLSGYRYKGAAKDIRGALVLVLHARQFAGVLLAAALVTADKRPQTGELLKAAINAGKEFQPITTVDRLRTARALMVRALDPAVARSSPILALIGSAHTGPWCNLGDAACIAGDMPALESLNDILHGSAHGVMIAAGRTAGPRVSWVRTREALDGGTRMPKFVVTARKFIHTRDALHWNWAREQARAERFEVLTHRAVPGSVILLHFAAASVNCSVSAFLSRVDAWQAAAVFASVEQMLEKRRIGLENPGPLETAGPLVRIASSQTLAELESALRHVEPPADAQRRRAVRRKSPPRAELQDVFTSASKQS
jgi:hypothetical protein